VPAAVRIALATLVSVVLASCGGGGSSGAGGALDLGPAPDVALLLVSGHDFSGGDPAYLRHDAGPEIAAALDGAGLDVAVSHFVDDTVASPPFGGYVDLVAMLEAIRDQWADDGTLVVVVAHSHGGVWAHGAIRAVPTLPIDALVDLDCSSFGWDVSGHAGDSVFLGLEPADAYDVGVDVTNPAYPGVPSQPGGVYDLEDVVFDHVAFELEVRSADSPTGGERFDEKWNCRVSGTTTGLTGYYSGSSHAEVHQSGGTTLGVVTDWLLGVLP
jgi:hypothetical protein